MIGFISVAEMWSSLLTCVKVLSDLLGSIHEFDA
jgi:hypothetical protein